MTAARSRSDAGVAASRSVVPTQPVRRRVGTVRSAITVRYTVIYADVEIHVCDCSYGRRIATTATAAGGRHGDHRYIMFDEAINYPRNCDSAVKTILVGGILSLLSVLVVPMFFLLGYYARVLRAVTGGAEEPPAFDEWGALFVDGLKVFAVGLAYYLVPTVIVGVSVGGALMNAIRSGDLTPGALAAAFLGLAVAGVLWLVASYVLPVALTNFVREDRLGAAFAVGDLKPVLFSGTYAMAWLLAVGLFIAASVLTTILNVVPPLGFVLGAFVTFYASVAAFYLYASSDRAVRSAPAEDDDTPVRTPTA